MKIKIILSIALISALLLTACSETQVRSVPESDIDLSEVDYIVGLPSYSHYGDAQRLTEAADVVVIGEIVDISFQVLDMTTGLPPTEITLDVDRRLTTIYDIEVITSLKGDVAGVIQMKIDGGIKDYRVEEQLRISREMNAWWKDSIVLIEYSPELKIGETYLLALCDLTLRGFETPLLVYMIPQQSVFNLKNPFSKQSLSGRYDGRVGDYSKDIDLEDSPLISAYDIVSVFGDDVWDEFWQEWQRDNPDWETRIDRAAVEDLLAKRELR